MRSAAQRILRWHRRFQSEVLPRKLEKLAGSPFQFFRGTYFLFARDLRRGPFRAWNAGGETGLLIGDVHTENFGAYRATNKKIVFDLNDFDEATSGPFEWDAARLATSILLGAREMDKLPLSLGDSVNLAEAAVASWMDCAAKWKGKSRRAFEKLDATDEINARWTTSPERSRPDFIAKLTEKQDGAIRFQPSDSLPAASDFEKQACRDALPEFLAHCLAPKDAVLKRYTFLDACRRVAGVGSLGRVRLAVLLDKGTGKRPSYETLRVIEWKEALDSGKARANPERAREVFIAASTMQLFPRRYTGYTTLAGMPMQGRELGSNATAIDLPALKRQKDVRRAVADLGAVLARAHLLAASRNNPPRYPIPDRAIRAIVRFAINYSEIVLEDHAELLEKRDLIETQWKKQSRNSDSSPSS